MRQKYCCRTYHIEVIFFLFGNNPYCRTVVGFLDAELNAATFVLAILKFIYIFVGSIIVAVVIGLLNAIVSRLLTLFYFILHNRLTMSSTSCSNTPRCIRCLWWRLSCWFCTRTSATWSPKVCPCLVSSLFCSAVLLWHTTATTTCPSKCYVDMRNSISLILCEY